jgi:hypothetical protein
MKEQLLEIIKAVRDEFGYQYIPDARVALEQVEQKLLDLSPWVSVEDKLPDLNKPVLLLYYKGKEGPFAIQGGLVDRALQAATENCPVDFWRKRGYGLCYVDYCDRDLQNLPAKKSKNQITHWMPLPPNPIY